MKKGLLKKLLTAFVLVFTRFLVFIVACFVCCILLVGFFLVGDQILNKHEEKIIQNKFQQEIAQVPELSVKSFKLWEGDSIVVAEVKNKGEVQFWYGENGIPRLDRINGTTTSYDCFFVNEKGEKIGYVFTKGLILNEGSAFKKWFPVEINNLQDLVHNYDQVVAVLHTFPRNSTFKAFEDSWGTRDVLVTSNPDFTVIEQYRGKTVYCDLFRR